MFIVAELYRCDMFPGVKLILIGNRVRIIKWNSLYYNEKNYLFQKLKNFKIISLTLEIYSLLPPFLNIEHLQTPIYSYKYKTAF